MGAEHPSNGIRIFLWGPMGSGKTFTGKKLAAMLELPFIDLDEQIEKQKGTTIARIFAERGESHFRKLEHEALKTILQKGDSFLLATGGGTPCFFDNAELMNAQGVTVYLKYPLEVLWKRLERERAGRPLLQAETTEIARKKLEILIQERKSCFRKAHILFAPQDPDADAAAELFQYFQQIIGH